MEKISVHPKTYFIKWRFVLEDRRQADKKNKDALFRYYIPKWSDFMREINENHRLSRDQQKELPSLRMVVPSTIDTQKIIDLLHEKNPSLARLLVEAAPIWDIIPHDLKCYLISAFGVKASEFLAFETANNHK